MTTIPSHAAITATGLRKSYGETLALDGIDLQVAEGTIFALLGRRVQKPERHAAAW
jgi:ABC-2 type transport system ATP-binding protein